MIFLISALSMTNLQNIENQYFVNSSLIRHRSSLPYQNFFFKYFKKNMIFFWRYRKKSYLCFEFLKSEIIGLRSPLKNGERIFFCLILANKRAIWLEFSQKTNATKRF
jgi:hypothetical protein